MKLDEIVSQNCVMGFHLFPALVNSRIILLRSILIVANFYSSNASSPIGDKLVKFYKAFELN